MHDIIKYNDKDYEIKHKLNFGEVRFAQKTAGNLIGMEERIKNANDDDLLKIAKEATENTDQQMELVVSTLIKCLGLTQEEINNLDYPDAVVLFNETLKASTEIKKKLNQPYV
jgi:hypothetical protein